MGRGNGYSNSYRSLEAIWTVLREHSSKENPLSVKEICEYLKKMKDPPSEETVKRLFPKEQTLISLLFPGAAAFSRKGTAATARAAARPALLFCPEPCYDDSRNCGKQDEKHKDCAEIL